MNWYKGHLWPYSPAILQVKVFYSSSILENHIACEICQKYLKLNRRIFRSMYDHTLKVSDRWMKISYNLSDDDHLPAIDIFLIKIVYFILWSYIFGSLRNISGIYMVILIWFPKSNRLDRTSHDPWLSHDRPSPGQFHQSVHVRPTLTSGRTFGDFPFSRNHSDYYIFITTYEK